MSTSKSILLSLSLVLTMLSNAPLVAQTNTKPVEKKAVEEEKKEVEEVIVTGTRLRNSSFSGIAPVQIIDPEDAKLGGVYTATDLIRQTSLSTGSLQLNPQLGATAPGGRVTNGGAGLNGISLRGLGTNRTLIVLDGRRLTPSGVQGRIGAVDLNTVPSSSLERVEIVKEGTSSVYGADAIAGVVNIITKKNYDGTTLNIYSNSPVDSGGREYYVSGNYGSTFSQGWFSISAEYLEEKSLKNKQRDFLNCSEDLFFDSVTNVRVDFTAPDGSVKCRNHNPNGAVFDTSGLFPGFQKPDPTGALVNLPGNQLTGPYLPGWVTVSNATLLNEADRRASYSHVNYDSTAYQNADGKSPLERFSLFLNGEYYINDNIRAYSNLLYSKRQSEFDSWMFLFQGVVGVNPNNTVAAGFQNAAATEFGAAISGNVFYQLVRPFNQAQDVNYYNAVIGFDGGLGSAWTWNTYFSLGQSDGEYKQTFLYEDRLNAISFSNVACNPAFLLPEVSPASMCNGISIPMLDPRILVDQNFTAEELAFIEGRETGTTVYDQKSFEAAISGPLFALSPGDVEAVFGVSFRRDEIDDTPGPNALANNYHQFSTSGRTAGSEDVSEAFVELGIPLLKYLPAAEDVNALISARYTEYDISGSQTTYKGGFNWSFTPSLGLRVAYGTSFRGANLYELYLADQIGFLGITDPCRQYVSSTDPIVVANCTSLGIPNNFVPSLSQAQVASGGAILPDGSTSIRPETSETRSVGFTFKPQEINLGIAIDYFDIEISDEIDVLGAQAIINQCYGAINFSSSPFCTLIARNSATPPPGAQAFLITRVEDRFLNIDSQTNRGIDLILNYGALFGGFGLDINAQATYTKKSETIRIIAGVKSIEDDLELPNEPQLTGSLDIRIDQGSDWSYFYKGVYLGPSGLSEFFGTDTVTFTGGVYRGRTVRQDIDAESMVYHTVSVTRNFEDGLRLTLGVNNLTDEPPPFVSLAWGQNALRTGVAAQNSWDLLGRRYFLTLKKDF